jgi:hypothetical protein
MCHFEAGTFFISRGNLFCCLEVRRPSCFVPRRDKKDQDCRGVKGRRRAIAGEWIKC